LLSFNVSSLPRRFGLLLALTFMAFAFALPAGAATGKNRKPAVVKQAAVETIPVGDPVAGKLKIDSERCQECHGVDGNANGVTEGVGAEGRFPRLAGQHVAYIFKQIRDFRSGARNHATMSMMAKGVSDADLADIAAYFSAQKRIRAERVANIDLGRHLFLNGDLARNILPCLGCHGEDGKGGSANGVTYPSIAGQHRRYLQKQLVEWRVRERTNSVGGVMNTVTQSLTDAEIDALSDYVAGLGD
jgi:cytochrome c553